MATQTLVNKNVRKITKVGKGLLMVTLPRELVTALGWKEKQKVVVTRTRGGLLIKDWKK